MPHTEHPGAGHNSWDWARGESTMGRVDDRFGAELSGFPVYVAQTELEQMSRLDSALIAAKKSESPFNPMRRTNSKRRSMRTRPWNRNPSLPTCSASGRMRKKSPSVRGSLPNDKLLPNLPPISSRLCIQAM